MDMALFHSIWTLLLMALFIGIVVWAWSSKRESKFDRAARAPLEEEPEEPTAPPRAGAPDTKPGRRTRD